MCQPTIDVLEATRTPVAGWRSRSRGIVELLHGRVVVKVALLVDTAGSLAGTPYLLISSRVGPWWALLEGCAGFGVPRSSPTPLDRLLGRTKGRKIDEKGRSRVCLQMLSRFSRWGRSYFDCRHSSVSL
ncbi:hypothetical protein KC357_g142 [Hortaea werneckii]|nr:hypothetical protein KC357_g142 [Hortaea werneckii]